MWMWQKVLHILVVEGIHEIAFVENLYVIPVKEIIPKEKTMEQQSNGFK